MMTHEQKQGLIGLVLVGAVAVAFFGVRHFDSCVIGASGTEASLVVRGAGASGFCTTMLRESDRYYRRTAAITEPVICEYDAPSGRHYVVHDAGALKLVGTEICEELREGRLEHHAP